MEITVYIDVQKIGTYFGQMETEKGYYKLNKNTSSEQR